MVDCNRTREQVEMFDGQRASESVTEQQMIVMEVCFQELESHTVVGGTEEIDL